MGKTALWMMVLAITCSSASLGSPAVQQSSAGMSDQMKWFEQNMSLGQMLVLRPGTPQELDEVRTLAQLGLAAARQGAEQDPDSAEAHYLLGSWLLYGYGVVEDPHVIIDANGAERTEMARRVVQGLTEDYGEGLEALKRATVLAPARGQYLVDYGAALFDCGEPEEALAVLRGAWDTQTGLTDPERTQAAVLLSRICLDRWMFREAREWGYSALEVTAGNAPAVDRLRQLDRAQEQEMTWVGREPALGEHETEDVSAGEEEPAPEGSLD